MKVRSSMIANLIDHLKMQNSKGAAEPPTMAPIETSIPEAKPVCEAPHGEGASAISGTGGEDRGEK